MNDVAIEGSELVIDLPAARHAYSTDWECGRERGAAIASSFPEMRSARIPSVATAGVCLKLGDRADSILRVPCPILLNRGGEVV
jgi:hypothetical protein